MLHKPNEIEGQKPFCNISQDHQLDLALDNKIIKKIDIENISKRKTRIETLKLKI